DEAIARIGAGTAAPVVQDESAATYCKKIDKDLPRIVWTGGARDIHNMVRGLNPAPVAWTTFRGRVLKIWRTIPFEAADAPALDPGEVAVYKKKRLLAGTGAGRLEIVSVQPETKKVMDATSFINGHRLQAGERLGV
ncbi:MAG TPA: methionyl-tRNA formyltransferase, partial [Spirochaetota bacterium]|nr:methionyl-tRNA formyltransferase [Spirochaetota bacterium]